MHWVTVLRLALQQGEDRQRAQPGSNSSRLQDTQMKEKHTEPTRHEPLQ